MDNLTSTALILTGVYSIIVLTIYINSIQPAKNKQLQYELDESESQLIEANKKKELLRLKNGLLEGHVKPESYQREFWLAMLLLLLTGIAICIIGYLLFQMISNFIKLSQNTGNVLFSEATFYAFVFFLLLIFFGFFYMSRISTKTIDVYYNVQDLELDTFKEDEAVYVQNHYWSNKKIIDKFKEENNIQANANYNEIYAFDGYFDKITGQYYYVKFTYRYNDNKEFLEKLKTLEDSKTLYSYISVEDMEKLNVSNNDTIYEYFKRYGQKNQFKVTSKFIENGKYQERTVEVISTKTLDEDQEKA